MSEISEPLIPLTKDEFILDLSIQLTVMNKNGDVPQVKGKGAPVSPEVRRMQISIFAKELGERLWRCAMRPMRIVRTNHASLHTGLAGPGWAADEAHKAEVAAMIEAAMKEGPVKFTQPPANEIEAHVGVLPPDDV